MHSFLFTSTKECNFKLAENEFCRQSFSLDDMSSTQFILDLLLSMHIAGLENIKILAKHRFRANKILASC